MPENPSHSISESDKLHSPNDEHDPQSPPPEQLPPIIKAPAINTSDHTDGSETQKPKPSILSKMCRRTNLMIIFTGIVAAATIAQVWTTCSQGKTLERQGDIMERQILADNRPWVDVKITVAGDGDMLEQDGGIRVPIKYETTNHGGTPAVGVWLHTQLVLFTPGFNLDSEQSKVCQMGQKDPPVYAFGGHDLFPHQDFKVIVTHVITKAGVEKSLQAQSLFGHPIDIIVPFIIGCVTYRFTFDHTIHTTPILVRLRKKNPNIIDDVPTLDFDSRQNLRTKAGPIPLNSIFVTPDITVSGMRAD